MKNLDNEVQAVVPDNVHTYVQLQTRLRRFEIQVRDAIDNGTWPLGVLIDMGLISQALRVQEPRIESNSVQTLFRYYYEASKHDEKTLYEDIDPTALAYHLIQHYVHFRSVLYVQASEDYLSTNEMAAQTSYSAYHIRTLIRTGEIEGIQTPEGWYGSLESLQEYLTRPNKMILPNGPKKGPVVLRERT